MFFRGTSLYAVSKHALVTATGPDIAAVRFHNLTSSIGPAFSIQPATSPAASSWDVSNGGTEYFVSQLDIFQDGTQANGLVVWALTNTSSLATGTPDLKLSRIEIATQAYAAPPFAEQRRGPIPLGDMFKQHLELLFNNDDRINRVVFAAGKLWTGVNTAIKTPNGPARTGIAWFILNPSATARSVAASVANQGVSVKGRARSRNVRSAVSASGSRNESMKVSERASPPCCFMSPMVSNRDHRHDHTASF